MVSFALFAAFVLIGAAALHYYNPLVSSDMNKLLSGDLEKMPGLRHPDPGMTMLHISHTQLMKKFEREWKDTEVEMKRTGASNDEIKGVLGSARLHFAYKGSAGDFIYGVPVSARRIWLRFRPVWIIDFRWGVGSENPKWGMTEPPGHVRALAIEGRKPYKILAMQTCS